MAGSPEATELRVASRPRDARVLRVPGDYPSVQAAVLAARDGDCVALSSGVHELQEPVCIDRDVHIIAGDEASDGVTIRLDASNSRLLRAATHMISIDCASCRIGSITLEHVGGKGDASVGEELVFAIWCRRGSALIDQCKIVGEVHSAVGVSAEAQPTISRTCVTAREYGVWVEQGSKQGVRVDRCSIRAQKAVHFSRDTSGELEQCVFEECGTAVQCLVHCDASITGCAFRRCKDAAIHCNGGAQLDDPSVVTIYGSEFENNTVGIVVDGARPEVHKNTFTGSKDCAIEVRGKGKGKYIGNSISDGAIGARVVGEANPMFRRNTFEGCKTGLLSAGLGSVGTYMANTMTDCLIAVHTQNKANPTVVSNVVTGAGIACLFDDGGLGRVRSNSLVNCGTGCVVQAGSNPTVEQNEMKTCGVGVLVEKGGKGSFSMNDVDGCKEAAIQLAGAAGTVLEENSIQGSQQEGVLVTKGTTALLIGNDIRANSGQPIHVSEDSHAGLTLQGNIT
eukprot:Hpha_TRINITY_DN16065_c2_g7::TRINITY_DN16065_c2_g7_i1::g.117287::m.117287/K10297/FBXO11; F-box protein 11